MQVSVDVRAAGLWHNSVTGSRVVAYMRGETGHLRALRV